MSLKFNISVTTIDVQKENFKYISTFVSGGRQGEITANSCAQSHLSHSSPATYKT